MFLRDAVSDPAFLSQDKWIRRSGWTHYAWTCRKGGNALLEVPGNGRGRVALVTVDDVAAEDWELVDPKDVCEGR